MQEREADGEAEEYNYLFDTHRKKYTLASKIEYDRNGNVKKIETFHESDFGWKKVKENSYSGSIMKEREEKYFGVVCSSSFSPATSTPTTFRPFALTVTVA